MPADRMPPALLREDEILREVANEADLSGFGVSELHILSFWWLQRESHKSVFGHLGGCVIRENPKSIQGVWQLCFA